MALDASFGPWEAALKAKERNRQQLLENIAGLGQGFNTIGQTMQAYQKKQLLDQIVQAMKTQGAPQQGPTLPGVGMGMAGQRPPQSGMGAAPQDNTDKIQALMMQYDPQSFISRIPTPLQQSEIAKNLASAQRYQNSPQTGTMTANQQLRQNMIDAINKRTDVLGQRTQFGQIDRLARATGMQPQLLKAIQTNNVRADRALAILSEGVVYPQKLNFALTDLAGIMQGGAPQLAELHNTAFPTWQQTAARARLYMTGNPNTPVPPQLVDEVKKLVQGIKEVDNQYIRKNAKFQTGMLGPTIEGFQKNVAPVVQQGTEDFIKGGVRAQGQADPLGIR